MSPKLPPLVWREIHFRRPIALEQIIEVLRLFAHDPRRGYVVLECRVRDGKATYLLGAPEPMIDATGRIVTSVLAGTRVIASVEERRPMRSSVALRVHSAGRSLRVDHAEATIAATLAAATSMASGTTIQMVLGDRRPAAVPASDTATTDRAALRQKLDEPSFGCVIRLGSASDRAASLMPVFQAIATMQAAGVRVSATVEPAKRLNEARVPWCWQQYLNITELAAFTVWPVGDGELAGVRDIHPVSLPPTAFVSPEFVVGAATSPGADSMVGLDLRASLRHLWVVGPSGTGKSELLANLALDTVTQGHGQAVVEPKGDLCWSIAERLGSDAAKRVVILDPVDACPLGLNPLVGGDPDVRAEGLLSIFTRLFGDGIGPRSRDVLHHALLSMTRRGDMSLPMLPLLLTNTGFRRSITQQLVKDDPVSLGAFWGWFENLSEAERSSVVAPVLNKVRIFTTNKYLRAVLGQRQPKLSIRQVLADGHTLLVPLQAGVIGSDAARLLGSLVAHELFEATLERVKVPEASRKPFIITIDELHQYVHAADFGEAMALLRGYKVGLRAAHQHLGQLPKSLRDALLQTARSRVVFQTGHRDAAELAKGHPELAADDITALGAFEIYASLMSGNTATRYVSARTLPLPRATGSASRVREASRRKYGRSLDDTETELASLLTPVSESPHRSTGRVRRQP